MLASYFEEPSCMLATIQLPVVTAQRAQSTRVCRTIRFFLVFLIVDFENVAASGKILAMAEVETRRVSLAAIGRRTSVAQSNVEQKVRCLLYFFTFWIKYRH